MARILPNGLTTGVCGDIVFYILNGKQCSRARNRGSKMNSPKQKYYQLKLATVNKFVSEMLDVVKIGWPDKHSHHFQKALGYHLQNAVELFNPGYGDEGPEFRINYQKTMLAKGRIPSPVIISINRNKYTIEIQWQTELFSQDYRESDSMVLVGWKPGLRAKAYLDVGNRKKGNSSVVLPYEFQRSIHLWAFYRNYTYESVVNEMNLSNSVYLGEF